MPECRLSAIAGTLQYSETFEVLPAREGGNAVRSRARERFLASEDLDLDFSHRVIKVARVNGGLAKRRYRIVYTCNAVNR